MTVPSAAASRRPVVGLMCGNEIAGRAVQAVASRFVAPLARWSEASVLLVPAVPGVNDPHALAGILDGLLLTGSRSHVSPETYGEPAGDDLPLDSERDAVALPLAAAMIEAGKPVYGVCRGMQEINVLFGGTLSDAACAGRHHRGSWDRYEELFDHRHEVALIGDGVLARRLGHRRITVNSVHEQGIDRLGAGLSIEAVATEDGLVEAIAARPCGADVLAVQWHPEWDVATDPAGRAFFSCLGASLRGGRDHPSPTEDYS